MDIYITPDVAKIIGEHRRVYTRYMPEPQLCITDKTNRAYSDHQCQGERWYYCPNCMAHYEYEESIPTLLEGIRICPICYRANQHRY